jgi:hypothetical protein
VGDYVCILHYSGYAKVLTDNAAKLKDTINPFTGCFISTIPTPVVHLRFGLKATSLFAAAQEDQGVEFIRIGVSPITNALEFVHGEDSMLKQHYERELLGWNLYYDVLSAVEDGLENRDGVA